MRVKKGFSLIEMLVVLGILAVLIGAGLTSFSSMTKKAQRTKAQELVSNVATALTAVHQREGSWPRKLLSVGASDGEMTAEVAFELAKRGVMSLTVAKDDKDNYKYKKTVGADRFGIVTPWAQAVLKKSGSSGSEGSKVPTGGIVSDHRLHFAIDDDEDGLVRASVWGETVVIRAEAAVWSCGADGSKETYTKGLRGSGVYSWGREQVEK